MFMRESRSFTITPLSIFLAGLFRALWLGASRKIEKKDSEPLLVPLRCFFRTAPQLTERLEEANFSLA